MRKFCRFGQFVAGLGALVAVHAAPSAHAQSASTPTAAQSDDLFRAAAYAGRFAEGARALEGKLIANPDDAQAVLGLGALKAFDAIAQFQRALYARTGTLASAPGLETFRRNALGQPGRSVLSLVVPVNPDATPMTYAALREILTDFVMRLEAAEKVLAQVADRDVKLVVQPGRVAIDLDSNGTIDAQERIFLSFLGRVSAEQRTAFITSELALDATDASWMRGYTNLIMGTVELLLAFDFSPTYEAAGHLLFGEDATAFGLELKRDARFGRSQAAIAAELASVKKRLDDAQRRARSLVVLNALTARLTELVKRDAPAADREELLERIAEERARRKTAQREVRQLQQQRRALQRENSGQADVGFFDLVAAVHSLNWRVADRVRLESARRRLLRALAINTTTWRLARAERDDDREFLPNAKQTAPFGVAPVTDDIIDGWLATTALMTDVLEGRRLIPHPRFQRGINVKRLLETATRIDFIAIASGHALVPYLDSGPVITQREWHTRVAPFGQDFPQFAIWFN
ncbi:MAG: hypothetical protein AAFQ42_02100 [Pseudomonadota bacterium]